MFGGGLGSFHSDILQAHPEDEVSKRNLVEEIKNRAKGSIQVKNYPEAIQLYSKGLELFPTDAILLSNRSMCHMSMKNAVEALSDATASIAADSTFAKAYYRKGVALVALNRPLDARATFEAGLALVPNDKSFLEQLQKLQSLPSNSPTSNSAATATKAATTTATTASTTTSSTTKKPATKPVAEATEEIASNMRGYKKTADGRVTSYFHNELDETTKQLIGDIAPKKIDAPTTTTTANANVSVWNTAGTWEEKNHSVWAVSHLETLFKNISATSVTITKAVVHGDASVTTSRNKIKHIYDFTVTLDWTLDAADEEYSGKVLLIDVTADFDHEVEIQTTTTVPNALLQQYVKSPTCELQQKIQEVLKQFYTDFMAKQHWYHQM